MCVHLSLHNYVLWLLLVVYIILFIGTVDSLILVWSFIQLEDKVPSAGVIVNNVSFYLVIL